MRTSTDKASTFLETPRVLPHLGIPISPATVDVRIIDTTSYLKTKTENLLGKPVSGHEVLSFPSYAFLITNRSQGTHVLFDLGMRKDWYNACPPGFGRFISDDGADVPLQVCVERDIFDILDADPGHTGVTSDRIAAVIWSHHHFDHRGDISKFPPHTKLIVGPGMLSTYLHHEIHESELHGREVIELGKGEFNQKIGGFGAHDAFGDGSFWIMSAPGHTAGHLCALARVTSSPSNTFVLLGGDCAYHCGEFRPSPYMPLPEQISFKSTLWAYSEERKASPPTLQPRQLILCAGEFIQDAIHPRKSSTEPFYAVPPEPVVYDHVDACASVTKLEVFDAHDDVLVCISHDPSLMNVLPFYPYTINDWYKKGHKQRLQWEFLDNFDLECNPITRLKAWK